MTIISTNSDRSDRLGGPGKVGRSGGSARADCTARNVPPPADKQADRKSLESHVDPECQEDSGSSEALPDLAEHRRRFDVYYRIFSRQFQNFPDICEHLRLKWEHSLKVLSNAVEIIAGSDFPPRLERAALLASLYHDIARFEQYARFNTFRDGQSFDHGARGSQILKQESWLLAEESGADRALVRAAVSMHNRAELPSGLPESYVLVTGLVRDADKIDIIRVLSAYMGPQCKHSPAVTAALPELPGEWSRKIYADLLAKRCARYEDLHCLNDFRLLVCTWLFNLNFPIGRRIISRQGYLREILAGLPHTSAMDRVRAFVQADLE